MATPFREDEWLDEAALQREVRWLIEQAGVHGLAVGGSTGEGHTLDSDELRRCAAAALEAAAGRVPVIAGVIVDSTRQALERAEALADLPLAALQVTPVHYLFRPDDESMFRHFATLADAARQPVVIYNVVPWCYCSPRLLARMLREIDGVVGVKQSAGDMKLLADLLAEAGDDGAILSAVDALLYPRFASARTAPSRPSSARRRSTVWRCGTPSRPAGTGGRWSCIGGCCHCGTRLRAITCRPT